MISRRFSTLCSSFAALFTLGALSGCGGGNPVVYCVSTYNTIVKPQYCDADGDDDLWDLHSTFHLYIGSLPSDLKVNDTIDFPGGKVKIIEHTDKDARESFGLPREGQFGANGMEVKWDNGG